LITKLGIIVNIWELHKTYKASKAIEQNSFNGKIIKLAIELDIIISNNSLKIILIFIVKIDKIQYLMVYQILQLVR